MISRRWNLFGLGAALAVAVACAILQYFAADRASAALAASIRQESSLVNEVRQRDNQIERADSDWARERRDVSLRPAEARAVSSGNSPPAPTASAAEAQAVRRIRANVDLHYRLFLTRLGLSPQIIAQWEAGAVKYNQRLQDISVAAADQGLDPTDPGVAALREAEAEQRKGEEAELLGADANAQLQQFNRVYQATNLAGELAGRVFSSETPLTALQGNQLTQILANASTTYQQGGSVDINSIDWRAVLKDAQGVLSGGQLTALQSLSAEHQVRHQLQQRIAALGHQP